MEFKEWLTIEEGIAANLVQSVIQAALQYVATQLNMPEGMGDEAMQKVAEFVSKKLGVSLEIAKTYIRCYKRDQNACNSLFKSGLLTGRQYSYPDVRPAYAR